MKSMFSSVTRGDDVDPFDPATSFVARLHRDLTARGFEVWFDRIAMPSRGLTFHQEIQDAVAAARAVGAGRRAKSRCVGLRAAGMAVLAPCRQDRRDDSVSGEFLRLLRLTHRQQFAANGPVRYSGWDGGHRLNHDGELSVVAWGRVRGKYDPCRTASLRNVTPRHPRLRQFDVQRPEAGTQCAAEGRVSRAGEVLPRARLPVSGDRSSVGRADAKPASTIARCVSVSTSYGGRKTCRRNRIF